jgi:ribonuclease D
MNSERVYLQHVADEYIASLPYKIFPGAIHLIESQSGCDSIRHFISNEPVLGFDTETKPSFKKGRNHQVALLQLATHDQAFLFRLNKMRLPTFIIRLLEDENITKVGVALKDDLTGLKRIMPLSPSGFIDLQQFVKSFGVEDNGLKKLAANILGVRISKKSQTSNWEQDELTQSQLEYAATDAWVCHQIYQKLTDFKSV